MCIRDRFYAAEYALAALLLLLCTWQRGTLDSRRQIGRKVFFRRLLLVLFVSVLGIALMTVSYTHLDVYKRQAELPVLCHMAVSCYFCKVFLHFF